MIQLENVRRSAGGATIIESASLDIAPGQCLCLMGPSGCGKTTLLETAAGLAAPDGGAVRLGTRDVACAFQDDALIPWMDAVGNVAYALRGDRHSRRKQAAHWVERMGLKQDALPPAMSGGMRRRLNLARAFAAEPQALFLDEPFAFLDRDWQRTLAAILADTLNSDAAVLMASHQTDMLDAFPCRIVEVKHLPLSIHCT